MYDIQRGNCSVCCRDEVLRCQKQFNDEDPVVAHESLTCVQFSSVNRKERKIVGNCSNFALNTL